MTTYYFSRQSTSSVANDINETLTFLEIYLRMSWCESVRISVYQVWRCSSIKVRERERQKELSISRVMISQTLHHRAARRRLQVVGASSSVTVSDCKSISYFLGMSQDVAFVTQFLARDDVETRLRERDRKGADTSIFIHVRIYQ